MNYPNPNLLVECSLLNKNKDDKNLIIVDCGLSDYAFKRAHIPGAVYRGGHHYLKRSEEPGNDLFLMEQDAFIELVKTIGIDNESTVVLYDDFDSKYAARFWWMLRYYGFENAKLLNGGWQAWLKSGYPLAFGNGVLKTSSDFTAEVQPERHATKEILKENYKSQSWQILDVRAVEEYEGRDDRGNKRCGHVPGAIHWEWSNALQNLDNSEVSHTFKPAEEIQNDFDRIGLKKEVKIITYCQAGIRASFAAFTLELMGYPVPHMYDGSMAEWANLVDTPLE